MLSYFKRTQMRKCASEIEEPLILCLYNDYRFQCFNLLRAMYLHDLDLSKAWAFGKKWRCKS